MKRLFTTTESCSGILTSIVRSIAQPSRSPCQATLGLMKSDTLPSFTSVITASKMLSLGSFGLSSPNTAFVASYIFGSPSILFECDVKSSSFVFAWIAS